MNFWPFNSRKSEPVGIPLSSLTREKLDAIFAPADRAEAAKLLVEHCATSLPLWRGTKPADFERIRLAVIKLSKGDLLMLERIIEQAHTDWRDVLMGAGFGDDVNAHLHWKPGK